MIGFTWHLDSLENTNCQHCLQNKLHPPSSYDVEYELRKRRKMSTEQKPPWNFRPDQDVEPIAESARLALGWTRTKLANEALRLAVPLLVARPFPLPASRLRRSRNTWPAGRSGHGPRLRPACSRSSSTRGAAAGWRQTLRTTLRR